MASKVFSNFNTDADQTPLYDSWGPADYWGCNEWVNWHKANVLKYGIPVANQKFVDAWLDGLSNAAGGRGIAPGSNYVVDSVPLDCRSFNSGFRDYIKKFPEVYNVVYSGIAGTIVKPIGAATDVVSAVSDGVSTTAKVVKYGIHFNPLYPQLSNIYISDRTGKVLNPPTGVNSDAQGTYAINVPEGAYITASFVGMQKQVVKPTTAGTQNFDLNVGDPLQVVEITAKKPFPWLIALAVTVITVGAAYFIYDLSKQTK